MVIFLHRRATFVETCVVYFFMNICANLRSLAPYSGNFIPTQRRPGGVEEKYGERVRMIFLRELGHVMLILN